MGPSLFYFLTEGIDMKKTAIVLFWWFLLLGRHPLVVGPFATQSQCESIQASVLQDDDRAKATACWADAPEPPRRTVRN